MGFADASHLPGREYHRDNQTRTPEKQRRHERLVASAEGDPRVQVRDKEASTSASDGDPEHRAGRKKRREGIEEVASTTGESIETRTHS